ncbi:Bug family tripartite tricarboxylate transporter substrate binding protein [Dankookia sp. GCM10030260]|uniref:Bug family tripartite tricarboxylate transporter substrate binding protein n=1 Tax=Dankookia sp. GCM10030260 TaxID=3273390 RepID=UPI003620E100
MRIPRRSLAALPLLPAMARAQAPWPDKPVRLVVGYTAGGPTDFVARLFQEPLQQVWGQPLVIENRPGASAVLGTEIVARSAPDGYTLLLATSVQASNPAIYARLPYDSIADFTAIALLYGSPTVLFVPKDSPLRTARDVVARARKDGTLAYATSGNGSSGHFAGGMLARKAGIDLTHIAYRGAAPALQDVAGGRVPITFSTLSGALTLARGGAIRAIAICAPQRVEVLPDVPTLAESDLDIPDTSPWFGLIGPAGLPPAVVQRIAADARTIIRRPEIRRRILDQGGVVLDEGPAEFAARIRREMEESIEVAKAIGIRAE